MGYLGSKGQHLIDGESNLPLSQLPASVLSLGRHSTPMCPIRSTTRRINPTSTLYTQTTVQAKQLMSAYPQYTSVTAFRIPQANSNYHSFTVEANKRFSHGLQVLAPSPAANCSTTHPRP